MDLNDTPEQARYRAQARARLVQHRDQSPPLQGDDERLILDGRRAWQGRLAKAGLAGVTWPVEYGGQGLGPVEQVIVNQTLARAGVPGILDVIGVGMLGPTIIAHGSDAQKSRYLPICTAGLVSSSTASSRCCACASTPARCSSTRAGRTRTDRASSVHGGIGATWEHDAPLFFRRAQLSRRLLGGIGDATDRGAEQLLREAPGRGRGVGRVVGALQSTI
jgi:alkylation response protein AidB-like acyl-CoA dehydrogenase